jgi:hypothetical protein
VCGRIFIKEDSMLKKSLFLGMIALVAASLLFMGCDSGGGDDDDTPVDNGGGGGQEVPVYPDVTIDKAYMDRLGLSSFSAQDGDTALLGALENASWKTIAVAVPVKVTYINEIASGKTVLLYSQFVIEGDRHLDLDGTMYVLRAGELVAGTNVLGSGGGLGLGGVLKIGSKGKLEVWADGALSVGMNFLAVRDGDQATPTTAFGTSKVTVQSGGTLQVGQWGWAPNDLVNSAAVQTGTSGLAVGKAELATVWNWAGSGNLNLYNKVSGATISDVAALAGLSDSRAIRTIIDGVEPTTPIKALTVPKGATITSYDTLTGINPLTVDGNLTIPWAVFGEEDALINLTVNGALTAEAASFFNVSPLTVGGSLYTEHPAAFPGLDTLTVNGVLTANGQQAFAAIDTITVNGTLNAAQAHFNTLSELIVNGGGTFNAGSSIDAGSAASSFAGLGALTVNGTAIVGGTFKGRGSALDPEEVAGTGTLTLTGGGGTPVNITIAKVNSLNNIANVTLPVGWAPSDLGNVALITNIGKTMTLGGAVGAFVLGGNGTVALAPGATVTGLTIGVVGTPTNVTALPKVTIAVPSGLVTLGGALTLPVGSTSKIVVGSEGDGVTFQGQTAFGSSDTLDGSTGTVTSGSTDLKTSGSITIAGGGSIAAGTYLTLGAGTYRASGEITIGSSKITTSAAGGLTLSSGLTIGATGSADAAAGIAGMVTIKNGNIEVAGTSANLTLVASSVLSIGNGTILLDKDATLTGDSGTAISGFTYGSDISADIGEVANATVIDSTTGEYRSGLTFADSTLAYTGSTANLPGSIKYTGSVAITGGTSSSRFGGIITKNSVFKD